MSSLSSLSFGVSSPVNRSDMVERFTAGGSVTAGKAAGTGYGAVADSVSLSPLGKALRDESLTAFNALSDKQRNQLVSLVDSGKMTGEEVHDALKQRVKEARSGALAAMRRMFDNDNAGLDLGGGDLRNALGATLDRRSSLMDKLAAATDPGERKSLSDTLSARGLNPLLSSGRSGTDRSVMASFFEENPGDSRLNSTRKEGDAAYKLESLGVDLGGIDEALRPIGEEDARAILSERAGLPSSRAVAHDASFLAADALRQGFTIGAPRDGVLDGLGAPPPRFDTGGGPVGQPRRIDVPKASPRVSDIAPAAASAKPDPIVDYLKGLQVRY
ncbi:hypothetical protein [Azospirillum agricola]|uniref:hypothetical protein n=1 Tax=Azospirillum agricola TaxID=1720247 RepID=UPI000A0F0B57|nr:hypothetical protein [Azospirillum agricola]SMH56530.1 hypothetical protein SAMN02982994_4093 [Azospirillum lipoferum]